MSLKLYFHPLASFCHKALIALYENGTPFEPAIVDLADEASAAAFRALWPMAKMPVLHDAARGFVVPESTVVVEYLDAHYPGPARLIPADSDRAWEARLWDRFFDHYVHEPMQKIVLDRLRPAGRSDGFGVEAATAQLRDAYRALERRLEGRTWCVGDAFTLADCAAAPALFYANTAVPFADDQGHLRAYLGRLMARPSYARVLAEAQPYFSMFPLDNKPRIEAPAARAAGARPG
jgi:glutathione S-transferase